ncbi:TolC family protein [Winogradskyella sp. SYSU M77433]|uniref:TolC family protein n=1 Tax=Winogradskyella sp. SYSU M77433 TaxID=3042722 RepID=UPI002480E447|nr:TolC family protein [Winogradskyella sp. SYSU M77433]MDH7912756.1 TolC family protein [Winogradskyella sp. SYSU M77433]
MKQKVNIILMILIFGIGQAQEVTSISKSEVLSKVQEHNTSIKISEESFNEAKGDFRQTNAIFLPNISVSHTGISTTNPLMAFGSKLNQEILTQNDFSPALLNDPDQTQNFATRIAVQQPLINLDGFYQRKAANSKMKAMELQSERTKDYMNFEVENAYMQLQLAYKAVDVLEKALSAAQANLELANNSFKQGYLHRSDVLSVEVRVGEVKNQLQVAKSNVKNASNYLSFLMNESSETIYRPSDSLTVSVMNSELVSGIENRADVKAMELASDARASMYKADKMTFLPTLNAFASYELYDDQIFQADANGYLFGAELKWNILEGTKRFGKAQKAKATYEKSKLEYNQYVSKSQLEISKTKRALEDAYNKLALAQLAVEQSKEALRIRTNRFGEGLEKTTDLLMAETMYAQKQLEYYQTIFQYNSTKAYLQFLTK